MQATSTYPEQVLTGEIFYNLDLQKATRKYEREHGIAPHALVTGYMERKETGERIYCNGCFVADASGKWFTVCHPNGTYTARVPQHESITVTLLVDTE